VGLLFFSATVRAEDKKPLPPQESAGLQKDIQALFRSRCIKCHGGEKPKAKLNLSNFESMARGGKSGLVIFPGQIDRSRLWQMIQQEKMPPKEPLPESERGIVRRWIETGAPGLVFRPEGAEAFKKHWAFQLPTRHAAPSVQRQELIRTEIDRFIEAALEEDRLSLAPEATRETLIRRVSFDLTGLPPTPAEIDSFLGDPAADGYERIVERYLASPYYGERWGKYWLDAAGYADSNGYFSADSDRPLAYRYRDYVIRSFNGDKPYDRFVREQLAGDELAGFQPDGDVMPHVVELLTATHFLRNAQDGTGESDGNPDEVRIDRYTVLEGTLQITMSSLLGITIQCARCHDHKFEPVAQRDYYSLQAIFFPHTARTVGSSPPTGSWPLAPRRGGRMCSGAAKRSTGKSRPSDQDSKPSVLLFKSIYSKSVCNPWSRLNAPRWYSPSRPPRTSALPSSKRCFEPTPRP
jgi:mono/diheme cytochrome c family protein